MTTPNDMTLGACDKNIADNLTPGQVLRSAREALGVSLRVMSTRTRIAESSLDHLERDMYDEFPVLLFLKGHLRCYSRELGLDSEQFVRRFEKYVGITPELTVNEQIARLEDEMRSEATMRSSASITSSVSTSTSTLNRSLSGRPVSNSLAGLKNTFTSNNATVSITPKPVTVTRLRSSGTDTLTATGSLLRTSSELARVAPGAVTGVHRRVIGRNGEEPTKRVRRGPTLQGDKKGTRSGENQGRISQLRQRMVGGHARYVDGEETTEMRRSTGSLPRHTGVEMRTSSQDVAPKGVQPRSKIERALPQVKAFVGKYYLALLALVVASLIAVGFLSGERATAQDPVNFPKNKQDAWELEMQADQTRWLLEQPDGQIDEVKSQGNEVARDALNDVK